MRRSLSWRSRATSARRPVGLPGFDVKVTGVHSPKQIRFFGHFSRCVDFELRIEDHRVCYAAGRDAARVRGNYAHL